jgi:hypothetical protein
MANQIQATIYQIDGNPQSAPITIDFLTSELVIREADISTIPSVQSAILYYNVVNNQQSVQTYYAGENVATLVALANNGETSHTQATVLEINGAPQIPGGIQYSFPSAAILIGQSINPTTGVNAFIQYKGIRYFTSETQATLYSNSNAGGGGGIIVVGSGLNSSVRCGNNNSASGDYSTAFGRCNSALGSNTLVGGGQSNTAGTSDVTWCITSSTYSGIYADTFSGYFTVSCWAANGSSVAINGDFSSCSAYLPATLSAVQYSTGTYSCYETGSGVSGCNVSSITYDAISDTTTFCFTGNLSPTSFTALGNCASVVVGGNCNTSSGNNSFTGGGNCNTSSGFYSFTGGGKCNTTSGNYSFTGSGYKNTSSGYFSFTGSGRCNTTSASHSFTGSGRFNTTSGGYAFTGGGICNITSGNCAFTGSGFCNTTSGGYSFTGGGRFNTTSGILSFTGSGYNNTASGAHSFVGGGKGNSTSSCYSFTGGGCANTTTGSSSITVGGFSNSTTGCYSFTGGGRSNQTASLYSVIVGGRYNISSGTDSLVVGGCKNSSTNNLSLVVGGFCNISNGIASVAVGGNCNNSNASSSFVGGGNCNTASSNFSAVVGGCCNQSVDFLGFVGGGFCNLVSASESFIGAGKNNRNIASLGFIGSGVCNNLCNINGSNFSIGSVVVGGIGNNTCGGTFNTSTCTFTVAPTLSNVGLYSFIGGGFQNRANADCSAISGGVFNWITPTGQCSFIGAGRGNTASGTASAVVGGASNTTNGCACAMIIGSNITADRVCATFVNNLSIKNIPTASAGLPAGSVWSDSGTLKIV